MSSFQWELLILIHFAYKANRGIKEEALFFCACSHRPLWSPSSGPHVVFRCCALCRPAPRHREPRFIWPYSPSVVEKEKEWRCDGAYLKYDELCGPLLFIPIASNIRPLSNKPLLPPPPFPYRPSLCSTTHTHTHQPTPCHLDMNGRLTFRAVSTLRSSFIQISPLFTPSTPSPS